ncbi:uncharacterized protein BYT42DRAFT_557606 [Radiomyces spectabilis]|uniref:uncharacterized protein n=1 Tax=Radiomyces spectabilis TaxID=64574 RepID=UPI00221F4E8B|nr:uncharacterized protein BYT42DRAFT_557606 [Radiomyces spectabilis]KAI8391652.1 hypothetical protein BYT42DRAFT_557606 [Radiomyces spectabilis]
MKQALTLVLALFVLKVTCQWSECGTSSSCPNGQDLSCMADNGYDAVNQCPPSCGYFGEACPEDGSFKICCQ